MYQPEYFKDVKEESYKMASLSIDIRNDALDKICNALSDNMDTIFNANSEDLKFAEANGLPGPIVSRLKFDNLKLNDTIRGIYDLIKLPDPLFKKIFMRELDEGLTLSKISCPIGVIGVIFESRPDALIQIASLCVKSGNCSILKGGSEAAKTNRAIFDIIHSAGLKAELPERFSVLMESRADIDTLLKCHESVDLIIPRGSNSFVRYITDNSKIPVMGHADGICHIYADKAAEVERAISIIDDAKTQSAAACNTAETLLVHKDIAATLLPTLKVRFDEKKVILKGCPKTKAIISCENATEEDFSTEYLDYIISIKVVDSLSEAIIHINKYGSHHTDCIITEDKKAAEEFMESVDSAGVYQNCSTRFSDGFRYGFGAEVGISTGKLHARGPVGLDGLISYKYRLYGNGHIVADYVEGHKSFNFRDIMC